MIILSDHIPTDEEVSVWLEPWDRIDLEVLDMQAEDVEFHAARTKELAEKVRQHIRDLMRQR